MDAKEDLQHEESGESFCELFEDFVQLHYSENTGILLLNARSHPPMEFILKSPKVREPEGATVSSLLNTKIALVKSIRVVYNIHNSDLDRLELHLHGTEGLIHCDKIRPKRA